MIDHTGRVAVVTGAASGIGRAATETLLACGGSVVAVDLDASRLDWASGNDRVAVVAGDVRDPELHTAAVDTALSRFGRLDALVLNAGVPMTGDLLTMPIENFDMCLEINVRGVLLGLRAAIPALRASGSGRVCITASTSGIGGDPNMWAYNTSKAGVINLARGAAIDLAADAITVNVVCPGPTETGMTVAVRANEGRYEGLRRAIPLQRWGQASEVANVIAFLVSPLASFVTGAVVPVDGGITANTGQFLPRPKADAS